MNKESGIYAIVNLFDGKRYIGQTQSFIERWRKHRESLRAGRHHCAKLQNAWNKHGHASFEFIRIETISIDQLNSAEQRHINFYQKDVLYNIALDVVSPMRGRKHTPEALEKMRERMRTNPPFKGRKHSPEAKAKIGDASRGERNHNFGIPLTHERKLAMIAPRLGRPLSNAHKVKLAAAKTGDRHPCARAVRCVETGTIFSTGTFAIRWLKESGHPKAFQAGIFFSCTGKRPRAYGYRWEFTEATEKIDG